MPAQMELETVRTTVATRVLIVKSQYAAIYFSQLYMARKLVLTRGHSKMTSP